MRRLLLGLLVLHGLLANLDAATKTWAAGISGDWFDPAVWSPPGVPQPSDTVTLTNSTTVVITDNVVIASLELRRASLVVSNTLTVTNLVLSDGAWLRPWVTRPTPLTNPPPDSGIIEIPAGGHLEIETNGAFGAAAFRMDGARLNLRGTGNCSAPSGSGILLFALSELNVYGTLNVSSEFNLDGANGPPGGSLNIYGVLDRFGGTNLNFYSANFTNRGTVLLQSGTMNLGNGLNSGLMNISFGATQTFIGAPFVWEAGGRFTGGGTVRLVRGTFDCRTNDLLVPNLHWTGGALQGTNTVTVDEATWDAVNATGAGDLIVTTHLNVRSVPGATGATFRGTRRLINRGKATFGTNAVIFFVERSSFRNDGFLQLGPGASVGGPSVAAAHPDVALLNVGTIISQANTTNAIWIRTTNSGNVRVDGKLQLQDQNVVQKSGNTIVSGALSISRTYRLDGGLLSGTGVVQGIVRNAGVITPGDSIGAFSIDGSLTNGGSIAIQLTIYPSGPLSDLLTVSGHLRSGGSLTVRYSGVGWPAEGTSWEVLRFGSTSGSFGSIQGLDLGGGHVLQPIFSPTNLVLVASNQPVRKYFFTTAQFTPGAQYMQELELRFTGDAGQAYSIDASSNLISWRSLMVSNSPDGIIYFRDSLSGGPQRFYRARQVP